MVDEADKDGTGLLTEKEFMQSSATEVWSDNAYRFITCLTKLNLRLSVIWKSKS